MQFVKMKIYMKNLQFIVMYKYKYKFKYKID